MLLIIHSIKLDNRHFDCTDDTERLCYFLLIRAIISTDLHFVGGSSSSARIVTPHIYHSNSLVRVVISIRFRRDGTHSAIRCYFRESSRILASKQKRNDQYFSDWNKLKWINKVVLLQSIKCVVRSRKCINFDLLIDVEVHKAKSEEEEQQADRRSKLQLSFRQVDTSRIEQRLSEVKHDRSNTSCLHWHTSITA